MSELLRGEVRRINAVDLAIRYYKAVEVKPDIDELMKAAGAFDDFIANAIIPVPEPVVVNDWGINEAIRKANADNGYD